MDLNDVVDEDRYSRLEEEMVFVIRAKRGRAARGKRGAMQTVAKEVASVETGEGAAAALNPSI